MFFQVFGRPNIFPEEVARNGRMDASSPCPLNVPNIQRYSKNDACKKLDSTADLSLKNHQSQYILGLFRWHTKTLIREG